MFYTRAKLFAGLECLPRGLEEIRFRLLYYANKVEGAMTAELYIH